MWQPEMELIDQLQGGPMSIGIVGCIFSDDERARRVLAIYADRGVLVLTRDGSTLPLWEAQQLLRGDANVFTRDDLNLTLTDAGAKAFETGRWDDVS